MEDSPYLPALMEWLWYAITFMYGAIVGSFLNVVIYRLPLGKPIGGMTGTKSYCPNCRSYLAWYHNVPLFGFLFLRGRCAYCARPISWRYFTVELLTACLWVALFHRVSAVPPITWVDYVFQAVFGSILIAMVFIDLDHFIAPTELNVVGFILGLGRDIACLTLAFLAGDWVFREQAPHYAYFRYLPRAIPGAIVYGSALFLVSYAGFLYYAKGTRESIGSATRRFLTFEDLPEDLKSEEERAEETRMLAEVEAEEARQGPPPRLRFSPGVTSLLAAILLAVPAGFWGALAFVFPLLAFAAITRRPGEGFVDVFRRFFSADDLGMENAYETRPVAEETAILEPILEESDTGGVLPAALTPEEEANQFARETESGRHGGMGRGDVNLALAIGAMLGPGLALLSLFFATLTGAIVGIIFTRVNGRSLRYGVPFVPFMAAGAIIVMLFGSSIVDWYLVYAGIRKPPPSFSEPPRRPRRQKPTPSAPPADPVAPYRGN